MKRFSLALLALPVLLAFTPAASADTFNFSFIGVGNTMSATGIFDATEIGSTGVYNITGITDGIFTDTNGSLNIVNAPITFIPDGPGNPTILPTVNGSGPGYTSPDGSEIYDNLLYYPGTPYNLDYWGGVLFSANGYASGYEVDYEIDIAQTLDAYGGWVSVLGSTNDFVDTSTDYDAGEPLDGNVQPTPELSSLLLFGTGLLALAFIVSRKAKARVPVLNLSSAFLTAISTLCSADLLAGCTGGVLAARAKPHSSTLFAHTVTEQTVCGVGRETHATAGQEAGATNSLTHLVGNAD
jgi:hypothetical protein